MATKKNKNGKKSSTTKGNKESQTKKTDPSKPRPARTKPETIQKAKANLRDSKGVYRVGGKFVSKDIQRKIKAAKTSADLARIVNKEKKAQQEKAFFKKYTDKNGVLRLRGANGKFLSKKEAQIALKSYKDDFDKGKAPQPEKAQKEIEKQIRWVETTENINTGSLRAVINSPEYENVKIVIVDIWGVETTVTSDNQAIEMVEDQNTHLYNIIDLIRQQEGEVISPHFTPLLIQRVKQGDTKNVNGIIVAPRVIRIDYNDRYTVQSLSRATWEQYKDIYKKEQM